MMLKVLYQNAFLMLMVTLLMDQLVKNVKFQFAMEPMEVLKLELAEDQAQTLLLYKLKNNGYQLLLNLLDHSQFALVPTVLMELTAPELYAVVPTDQRMDHQELHAPEKSQLLSHITTLNQPPDSHIKTLETSVLLTHLLLTHQLQFQLLSFKLTQLKVLTKKQLPL
jgi:hypothetical protein